MKLEPRNYHSLIVSGLAIIFYFVVYNKLNISIDYETMFASTDSRSYKSLGDAIFNGQDSIYFEIRPIGFPIIITFLLKGGYHLVWFYHLLLWVLSTLLVFKTVLNLTSKYLLSYIGAIVFVFNYSLIAMTFHGLTEVTTVFLLAMFAFFISRNINNRTKLYFIHGILFLLAILTIIKPSFFYLFLLAFIFGLPFYLKKYRIQPKKIIILLFIISPVILQMSIMKSKYNTISVSDIGKKTFVNYIYTQGYGQINELNRAEALELTTKQSKIEIKSFLKNNLIIYKDLFWENIEENIKSHSIYLNFPNGFVNKTLFYKMIDRNKEYYFYHVLFFYTSILLFLILLWKKDWKNIIILICFGSVIYYYLFTTGISFYQGDRLVMGVFALCIIYYLFLLNLFVDLLKERLANYSLNRK